MKVKIKKAHSLYLEDEWFLESFNQTTQSYLGIMSHANCQELSTEIKNKYWIYHLNKTYAEKQ